MVLSHEPAFEDNDMGERFYMQSIAIISQSDGSLMVSSWDSMLQSIPRTILQYILIQFYIFTMADFTFNSPKTKISSNQTKIGDIPIKH